MASKKTCPMIARSDWGVGQIQQRGLAHSLSKAQSPVGFHGPKTAGWLVFLNGAHRGEDMRLPVGESKIGSNWQCDLVLTGVGVGSAHALMRVGVDKCYVSPHAGNRLVKINNEVIGGPCDVADGALITFGELHAVFRSAEAFLPGYKPSMLVAPEGLPHQSDAPLSTRGWLVIARGPMMGQDFRLVQGRNRLGLAEGLEVTIVDSHLHKSALALNCKPTGCIIDSIAEGVSVRIGEEVAKKGRILLDSEVIQIDHLEGYLKWL